METMRGIFVGSFFVIGGFALFAAFLDVGDETTTAIAEATIAVALLLIASAMTIEHRLNEIKHVAERQNDLLEEQVRMSKYLSSSVYRDRMAQRKENKQN